MKHTCELCSMDATFKSVGVGNITHYFCDHHAPEVAVKIEGIETKKTKSKISKFLPLILIFGLIFLFTIVTSVLHKPFDIMFSVRMMMGAFFGIFGLFKIFNLKAFAEAYSTYDVLAKRSKTYAYVYPFIEISLSLLYLLDVGGIYRDLFTFVLMSVSSVGVIQKLRLREEIPCACLGMVFKVPMTYVTLIEDLVMAIEALSMVLLSIFFIIIL